MLRRDVLLGAALLAPATARAQAPARPAATPAAPTPENLGLSAQRLAQATEVLANAVTGGRINGAVFGIMRHGKPAWLRAVGFRDTAQAEPLKPDAIFPLAAMTRPIASVAAMVLVERGRLALADPLSVFLPGFREMRVMASEGIERARRPIILHDLLRQTAGLTDGLLYPDSPVARLYAEAGVQDPARSLAEAMDALARLPLLHQPGTIWEDSLAADVLSRVVEVASGQAFDNFLAREVLGPLRMADTRFAIPEKDHPRLAQPRIDPLEGAVPPTQDGTRIPKRIGGAAGLLGTAGDYLRFGQALLAGGTLDTARVLGGGTVAHMVRDHLGSIARDSASGAAMLGEGRGFGLGVSVRLPGRVEPLPGSTGDYGWGSVFGTQFLVDPAQELVAVLMVNQSNQAAYMARLFRTLVYQTLAR